MHRAPHRSGLLAALALIGTLVSGCEDAGTGSPTADSAAADADASPAYTVEVSADKTHAVQPSDVITLEIEVPGFRLDMQSVGQSAKEGVGHYRIYLDGSSGEDYLMIADQSSVQVEVPEDITDGSHELRVVLYGNDRSPVQPISEGSVLLIVYRL